MAASAANRLQEFVDEATGVENLSCYDFSQLPECEFASVGELHGMPQQLEIPAVGGSSIKRKRRGQHVSISGKTQRVQAEGLSQDMDSELLPELPAIEIPAVGSEQARPAVGGRQNKHTSKAHKFVVRFASASIPWRSLPYMRVQALEDIHAIADLFGGDLGSLSPPAEWLDVGEARRFLKN